MQSVLSETGNFAVTFLTETKRPGSLSIRLAGYRFLFVLGKDGKLLQLGLAPIKFLGNHNQRHRLPPPAALVRFSQQRPEDFACTRSRCEAQATRRDATARASFHQAMILTTWSSSSDASESSDHNLQRFEAKIEATNKHTESKITLKLGHTYAVVTGHTHRQTYVCCCNFLTNDTCN